jgi:hydrogenase expression/formation protein HypE
VRELARQARDVTRGGLAAVINELAQHSGVSILLRDANVPVRREVRAITDVLGVDVYALACEGRFVCAVPEEKAAEALSALKRFNAQAAEIGEVAAGSGVVLETRFGRRQLRMPSGIIVPRIC